jgi:hypothetical protein
MISSLLILLDQVTKKLQKSQLNIKLGNPSKICAHTIPNS